MRILVILSHNNCWGTKTSYTNLRKFLIKDGYQRISQEVFMRVVVSHKACAKHLERMEGYKPSTGVVRVFLLTEKQYERMYLLCGELDYQEEIVGKNVHVML